MRRTGRQRRDLPPRRGARPGLALEAQSRNRRLRSWRYRSGGCQHAPIYDGRCRPVFRHV